MNRLRSRLEDRWLTICAIPLVLLMCVLYWLCRLCGVRLEDDF